MSDITGTDGPDNLEGTPGDDTINGLAGDDTISGLDGNDLLEGKDGNDTVHGGLGADYVMGGSNNDILYGDEGNDQLFAGTYQGFDKPGGSDTLYGGDGDDILSGESGDVLEFANYGWVDTYDGGAGNDRIFGTVSVTHLNGGIGDDLVRVYSNQGSASGGAGIDTLSINLRYDYLARGQVAIAHVIDLSRLWTGGIGKIDGTSLISGFERIEAVVGGQASDRITLGANLMFDATVAGLAGNDVINGGSGSDTLIGDEGNDRLIGGAGNDNIYGDLDNDILDGGAGADWLRGGAGNDVYIVDNGADFADEGGAFDAGGIDIVKSSVNYALGAYIEKLTLTGTAATSGQGNDLANTLAGNGASNQLYGLGGNDVLSGNGGNDFLLGELGNDKLNGGAGHDTLSGGYGADVLNGGADADAYRFDVLETSVNKDTIQGFVHGVDQIEIARSAFTAFAADPGGAIDPSAFATGAAATTADQHLIYNNATGALYYDPDGAGGEAQVQIALLAGKPTLDASDIFLI